MGKVAVLHPDLGIGGAERLIVDACKALQDSGHQVTIYTGFHDRNRCFEETKNKLNVVTVGSWIPRSILGRCHAVMAYLKMIIIALYVTVMSKHDLVLCDQVSVCIPFLKIDIRNRAKVIFYCHFPDQLLTYRDTLLKSLYRKPIDYFEEITTGLADVILVNSKFTSSVVRRTFKSLTSRDLTVLYPCVDVSKLCNYKVLIADCREVVRGCVSRSAEDFIFLSLNRFERKKNLALAIEALSEFKEAIEQYDDRGQSMKAHLIVAGGYDERLRDCVQYYEDLKGLVDKHKLGHHVTFVQSPSDNEKLLLIQISHAIVYTPKDEHFGIVPLEAMALSKPVIATATGGPLETVEHDVTGVLCESDTYSFADAMLKLYSNRKRSVELGKAGHERVRKHFSYEAFRHRLNEICYSS